MYEISILFIPLFCSMQSIPALAYRFIMKGLEEKGMLERLGDSCAYISLCNNREKQNRFHQAYCCFIFWCIIYFFCLHSICFCLAVSKSRTCNK